MLVLFTGEASSMLANNIAGEAQYLKLNMA